MKFTILFCFMFLLFVLGVKSDADYTPEGCFGTTGCWTYCSNLMGTCSSPFKRVIEEGSNGGNNCYCYRPYTEEELNKKKAGECERFINQCFSLSNSQYSCNRALATCDKESQKIFCQIIYDLTPDNQKHILSGPSYGCTIKGIWPNKNTLPK